MKSDRYGWHARRAPRFVNMKRKVQVREHETLALAVTASGASPMTYQWKRNGVELTSQIDSRVQMHHDASSNSFYLLIIDAKMSDAGQYECVLSNQYGQARSVCTVQIEGKSGKSLRAYTVLVIVVRKLKFFCSQSQNLLVNHTLFNKIRRRRRLSHVIRKLLVTCATKRCRQENLLRFDASHNHRRCVLAGLKTWSKLTMLRRQRRNDAAKYFHTALRTLWSLIRRSLTTAVSIDLLEAIN